MTQPTPTPDGDEAPSRSRRRFIVAAAVVGALLVAVGLTLFQPWRLLTHSTVDEPVPAAATTSPHDDTMTEHPTVVMTDHMTEHMTDHMTEGTATAATPQVLTSGTFVDGEHETSGTVTVIRLADGTRYVRLEAFSTSDGPDVDVWLTDQPAGGSDWGRYDDGRYVALGDLKGTDGNQNYAIPADADLSGLTSVVIWCDRFNVAFGTAAIRLA